MSHTDTADDLNIIYKNSTPTTPKNRRSSSSGRNEEAVGINDLFKGSKTENTKWRFATTRSDSSTNTFPGHYKTTGDDDRGYNNNDDLDLDDGNETLKQATYLNLLMDYLRLFPVFNYGTNAFNPDPYGLQTSSSENNSENSAKSPSSKTKTKKSAFMFDESEHELPTKLWYNNLFRSFKMWCGLIVFIFTFAYVVTLFSPFRLHHQRRVMLLHQAEIYVLQPTCANHMYNVQTMELNQCKVAERIISGPAPWELAFYDTMHDIGLCADNKCSLLGIDWFAHVWWAFIVLIAAIVTMLVLGVKVSLNNSNAREYNAHYSMPNNIYPYMHALHTQPRIQLPPVIQRPRQSKNKDN
jgi:hypothetical protein